MSIEEVSEWAIETDDTKSSGFYFWMDVIEITRRTLKGVPNVVVHVRWRLTAELENCPECGETHVAYFEGATPILPTTRLGAVDASKFDAENAIPYEELTVEQIVEWVEQTLNQDLHPFEMIVRQINQLHSGGTANNRVDDELTPNLPWMNQESS